MRKDNETLSPFERWAQLFIIVGTLLLGGYFYLHQVSNTGFFTEAFGTIEQVALYGPILISFGAPLVKLLTGQRNLGRLFDALTNLSLAAGSFWLVRTFPFDFSHLADPLPAFLRWPIAWIRDPIARILLWVQVILGTLTGLSNVAKFLRRLNG